MSKNKQAAAKQTKASDKVVKMPQTAESRAATAIIRSLILDSTAAAVNKYFDGVIGQFDAKKELSFYLDNHIKNGAPLPNMLLTGSKGDGKTHLAKKLARNFPDKNDPSRNCKKFLRVDGPSVSSLSILFEDICSDFANGDDYVTVFVDEAHELPKKVQTALLTVLEPNSSRRTKYTYQDVDYHFDFNKVTWIFATTEDDRIFHALRDRLVCIQLQPYSQDELSQIVELNIDGALSFEGDTLSKAASYIRRNGRSALRIAENILALGTPIFQQGHLDILIDRLNLYPYGLMPDEVRALTILESQGECSLGHLSSTLGKPSKATQKEVEPYLISLGLIEIDGKRRITGKGKAFLKEFSKKILDSSDKNDILTA